MGNRSLVLWTILTVACLAACATNQTAKPDANSAASRAPGLSSADIKKELPAFEGRKILVVYFSQGEAAARVAADLVALSGGDVERIVEKKTRKMDFFGYMGAGKDATFGLTSPIWAPEHDPSAYDAVIAITPVWSWSLSPPIRSWLRMMKGRLPVTVVFASVSGDTKPDKIVKAMEKEGGVKAAASAGFSERDFYPENRSTYLTKIATLLTRQPNNGFSP